APGVHLPDRPCRLRAAPARMVRAARGSEPGPLVGPGRAPPDRAGGSCATRPPGRRRSESGGLHPQDDVPTGRLTMSSDLVVYFGAVVVVFAFAAWAGWAVAGRRAS